MTPLQGDLLGDRYRLDEALASGGMGQVWRATDELLGRLVAIKVLHDGTPTQTPGGADFRERFREEARHSAALSHPNIATVFDFGDDHDHPYLVMELVEGENLATIVAQRGGLPPDEVASLVGQAALALQAAHGAGVVHRDIKPANIMVTAGGMVKLTDFGIARLAAGSGLTRTGEVLGTPHYLAPEQAQGQPATAASDVYALGVVAHELLTGERPFDGESMVATALAHVSQPAPELPETVPEPLRSAVMAALAKDPQQRPASAGDLAAMVGMPVGPDTPLVALTAPEGGGLEAGGLEAGTVEAMASDGPSTGPAASQAPTSDGAAHERPAAVLPHTTVLDRAALLGRGRPRWLLPLGGAVAVLAAVVAALALAGPGAPSPRTPTPPVSPTSTRTTQAAAPGTRSSSTPKPAASPTSVAATVKPAPAPAPAHAPGQHKGKGKGGKKK